MPLFENAVPHGSRCPKGDSLDATKWDASIWSF